MGLYFTKKMGPYLKALWSLIVLGTVIELFAKQQNNAQNMLYITKRQQHCKISLLPVFLLKIRPDSARIFTKMTPNEELVTLGRAVGFSRAFQMGVGIQ